MARVLITGISGFVGSHLAELLLEQGMAVYGTIRWRSNLDNIRHIQNKLKLIETDIKDAHSMQKTVDEVEPDYVFHLAAQSFVPTSWKAPSETVSANILGTVNLFEAIRNSNSDPRIQVAGSSEEYGMVFPDVTSNFAKQVAEIEKGLKEPVIHVGNLNAQRDFTDVRDIVNAYWLSVQKCKFGEVYNICSGVAREIQSVFDILQGMVDVQIEVKQNPDRMRPSDVEILMCDCSKFRERTGWVPKIAFKDTMKDLLDYWRKLAP
jgi:GDP-4-dehydro-6-deoxy-D-mannose reductase